MPEAEKKARGARVRALRKALDWTQDIVAERSGKPEFSRNAVAKIENGDNAATTSDVRHCLARAFGVEPERMGDFIEGKIDLAGILSAREFFKVTGGAPAVPEPVVEPPRGHYTLENVLRAGMPWPEDVDIEAADLAIADARAEAYSDGSQRPETLWVARLLQLYRQRTGRAKTVHQREPVESPEDRDARELAEEKARRKAKKSST